MGRLSKKKFSPPYYEQSIASLGEGFLKKKLSLPVWSTALYCPLGKSFYDLELFLWNNSVNNFGTLSVGGNFPKTLPQ